MWFSRDVYKTLFLILGKQNIVLLIRLFILKKVELFLTPTFLKFGHFLVTVILFVNSNNYNFSNSMVYSYLLKIKRKAKLIDFNWTHLRSISLLFTYFCKLVCIEKLLFVQKERVCQLNLSPTFYSNDRF